MGQRTAGSQSKSKALTNAANDLRATLERSGVENPQIFVQEYDSKTKAKPVDFPNAEELGEADDAFVDVESDVATEADPQEASSSAAQPKAKAKKGGVGAGGPLGGSRKAAEAQAVDRLAKIILGKARR